MSSAECLMELDQKTSVKRCHNKTMQNIEDANKDKNLSTQSKLEKICK